MDSRGKKVSGTLLHALIERFHLRRAGENPEQEKYQRLACGSFLLAVLVAVAVVASLACWLATRDAGVTGKQGEKTHQEANNVRCKGQDTGLLLPDEEDCSSYWVCSGGRSVREKCDKHHYFDMITLSCQWIHVAQCHSTLHIKQQNIQHNSPPTLSQIQSREAQLVNTPHIKLLRDGLTTLDSAQVELVVAGRASNPTNVAIVESIVSERDWDYLFPWRAKSYTYDNFLRSVAAFPMVCSSAGPCRRLLATMFAHFVQETGAHAPASDTEEWRQGLKHLEEVGYSENSRAGAYSANCAGGQWTAKAWPCGKDQHGDVLSYHGRGAKQLSYNYNYGQFSMAMYGSKRLLLDSPSLVASTWLNLASALWFFSTPQPPKPSMLSVMSGRWKPNQHDTKAGLLSGFGLTTNIINGGIECGKGRETKQSLNRIKYYKKFAQYLQVALTGEGPLGCANMGQFGSSGSGAVALYWEQDWANKFQCKLVTYVTPYSALLQGDYTKCVNDKFHLNL